MSLSENIRRTQIPKMAPYLSKEDFEYYSEFFRTNRSGLLGIDNQVYVKMFGYKDASEYYSQASVAGDLHNISVPTFSLNSMDD